MSLMVEEPRSTTTRTTSRSWQPVRATVAAVAAAVSVACLLWGLSSPGFGMDAATVALGGAITSLVLAASWGGRARRAGRSRPAATAVLAAVTLLLSAGVVAAGVAPEAPLRARWAGSHAAFDAHVATLGAPTAVSGSDDSASFSTLPGGCPPMIGSYPISRCLAIDHGYLFLQTGNPITDDSGFAYLPGGIRPEEAGLDSDSMTSLGGPWWTWSCYC